MPLLTGALAVEPVTVVALRQVMEAAPGPVAAAVRGVATVTVPGLVTGAVFGVAAVALLGEGTVTAFTTAGAFFGSGFGFFGYGYPWYYPGYPYYPYSEPYYGDPYYDSEYYGDTYYGNQYYGNFDPRSSATKSLQTALARRGYYRGPIDGVFGSETRNAIRSFQAHQGLPVTGQVDSRLIRALQS